MSVIFYEMRWDDDINYFYIFLGDFEDFEYFLLFAKLYEINFENWGCEDAIEINMYEIEVK